MDINPEEVKEALKKISLCQPMNEHLITADLELVYRALQSLPPNNHELPYLAAKHIIEFRQFTLNGKLANTILLSAAKVAQRDNIKGLETLRLIMDPEKQFFRYHDQLISDETKFSMHPMAEGQYEFCAALKEECVVDALKEDEKCGVIAWSRGRIYKCNDKFIWVRWLGDDNKRKIQRYSMDLAPLNTKCTDQEWEWRHSLKSRDIIDCVDNKVWQNATITDRIEYDGIVEYNVGFRFYAENGPFLDIQTGDKYFGWNQQYDEKLKATNPRIQLKDSYAKNYCKYSSMTCSEETIQDCNDFLYPENTYVIPRYNTKSQRRSQIMIELVQQFGDSGGFQYIIEQLENPACQIDVVHNFMVILGNLHEMLSRPLVQHLVPKIWPALQYNILNSSDGNLRNFGTQKIQDILNAAGALLKRVYSLKEKTELIDKFDLDIAFKCFSSDFLERKIQGLKAIQDLIKKTKEYQINMENSDIKFLSIQIMVEWLNEKKIFESLYVNTTNSHLVQRSAEFFKFMLDEKLITQEHINMMWAGVNKGETEHKLAIYKLFKDVSQNLDKEQLDFLTNRVCSKEATSITKDDIELLQDLTKYNYRFKEEFCQKFAQFYWNQLTSGKLSTQMTEQFLAYYIEQVTSFEMRPHKSSQISMIGAAIIQGGSITIALRVLMKFVDKLEICPSTWDQYTRNLALTELESKHHVVEEIIASFNNLKTSLQESQYLDEVKTRMQFIQFFYQNITTAEYRLTFHVISSLWEQLVCQSVCQAERDLVYKWFSALSSQSTDGQSQLSTMVPVEDLKQFFLTKMTQDPQQLIQLTEEGFSCFKTVLQAINKQDQAQFGLDVLWRIVLDSTNAKVAQSAIELYHTYDLDLPFVFEQLNQNLNDNHRLYRCLVVLEDMIDQSEINGVGSLKSLNALSKGEEVSITVLNEHSSTPLIPKKMVIKINDNQTIIELRQAISKQIKSPWDTIGLNCTKGEIKSSGNGRRIKDLRLKKGETILAFKKPAKELPETQLLDEQNMLTEPAKLVFGEIFSEYSSDGKMNKEDCTRFVTGCTGNPCTVEDSNISRTFEQFDKDKDGYLQLSDFLDFYTESARSKKSTVWLNLQTLHYRQDLVRGDRVPLPVVNSSILPRAIIVRNQEWQECLFSLLENADKNVQEQAWYLLRRLPPSSAFLRKMLTFDGITDWDSVLINSNYRLLYSLHIIEFLMSGADSLQALLSEENPEILTMRDRWMGQFLQLGGFDKLLSYFKYYQGKSVDTLSLIEKEILSFLLKTFQQYLVAACCIRVPKLYKAATVISSGQPLDQILDLLREHCGDEEPVEFKDLLCKLRDDRLGESIIAKFELEKFLAVLIQLVRELLKAVELESEERSIIEYSVVTAMVVLLYDRQLLVRSIENQEFINLFFSGIFTDKSANIRNLFSRAILVLCHQTQGDELQPTRIILEQLIRMQNSDEEFKKNSAQYYELLCQLIDSAFEQEESQQFLDFKQLSTQILDNLDKHKSTETRSKTTQVDRVLIGLLNLLQKLLRFIDQPIVDLLFNECLFNFNEKEVKCKSAESRAAAFNLIQHIAAQQQSELEVLIKNLLLLSQRIPAINKWNYVPSSDMRSQTGYCGIRNLRCICYMNAMLQQFYMTPPFRYGILHANDNQAQDMQVNKTGLSYDDNVLHQLQQMFGYLELTDRVDYNPQEFCAAFKDYSGEPVNIFIQQDAQEFLNMIFDKLENLLKGTAFKYILDGVYGGKTSTQIVCSECKHAKSKVEQFYNLSLAIKNLKNLSECFDKYIEGETISDFRCDNCEKKADVTKRQMLHQLPNVLILHLQRIVFNLDTFMNEKINSRLEFPNKLDLSPYVAEDAEKQSTEYRLVGVVVHLGTADVGHYFSYIDINRDDGEQWLEFNDSKIKEFKAKNLEAECFGGQSGFDYNDNDVWGMGTRENSQSAYILVYEKIHKDPIKLVFSEESELINTQQVFKEATREGMALNIGYYDIKPYIPEELTARVNQDNQQFMLERNLFSQDLMKFILEVCDLVQGGDARPIIEVLLKFNYDLLAKAYENSVMETFSEKLIGLLTKFPDDGYLDLIYFNRQQKTVDLLLICPETKTRKQFGQLLSLLFNQVINTHKLSLDEHDTDPLNQKIVDGLDQLFAMIQDNVPKNWVRFDQYFQFWLDFLNEGEAQLQYLLRKQGIAYILDFILDKHSPVQLYEKKHSIGNTYYQINYTVQIQILCALLKHNVRYSLVDKKLLYSYRLYDKLFKSPKVEEIIPLVLQFAYNDQFYSEIICGCILRGISTHDTDEFKNHLQIMRPFIQINDKFKLLRIEWLLGIPTAKQTLSTRIHEGVTKPKTDLPNFGVYGLTSLEEDFWSFTSPLGWQITMMDYFTQNKTQKSLDNQCLLILKYVLQISLEDQDCFNYLSKLPSTNYLQKSLEDIFKAFLDTYNIDTKRYYSNYPRKQESEETKILLDQYIDKISPLKNEFQPTQDYLIGRSVEISQLKRRLYLMNALTKEECIVDEPSEEFTLLKESIEDGTLIKLFILEERTIKTNICDNLPTGITNEGLPSQFVKGTQFYNYQVDQNSLAANFIQSKAWNYDNPQAEVECDIKNPRVSECVKQIQITNNHNKHNMHVMLEIQAENAPHFVPKSRIQSLMQAKSTATMFTIIKHTATDQFVDLQLTLIYRKQDKKTGDNHVYLSTPEEQDLELLHNDS